MIGITILGATGTIGINTLKVIAQHRHLFNVVALTANKNVEQLVTQCRQWTPQYAVMADPQAAEQLQERLRAVNTDIIVLSGVEGLLQVVQLPTVEKVMAAIVGGAGLLPVLAAAKASKCILLANKEALVMGGALLMETVQQYGATLLPIDSEHNAIFQCMPPTFKVPAENSIAVERILLTASGGPFRDYSLAALQTVTPAQACHHPNWRMGPKISVDSATMMNKGLEVIEAYWLFLTPPEQIEVLIHPQSIIHSMVEYVDGSVIAQLSHPDMQVPIAHALTYPQRIKTDVTRLNLVDIAQLTFSTANLAKYPCLRLAYDALKKGGTATTILNAANEMAVEAFLQGHLVFTEIATIVETTLSQLTGHDGIQLPVILEADRQARAFAQTMIEKRQ